MAEEGAVYTIEAGVPLAQSQLWALQARYYAARGPDAWRLGDVPFSITNSAAIAEAYAEVILGLWRDRQRLAPEVTEPLVVCELGAGCGRLGFRVLGHLCRAFAAAGVAAPPVRYVLTDQVDANVAFWREHPSLAPFVAAGLLDFARFDVTRPGAVVLEVSGRRLEPGALAQPLVVVANYVFDSVPQELLQLADGRLSQPLINLWTAADPETLGPAEVLAALQYRYEPGPPFEALPEEPWLRALLDGYRRQLRRGHLLFPATALRCVEALRGWSRAGALLLVGDKGEHRLSAWEGHPPPTVQQHGSVSLPVNLHAFAARCEQLGGLARFPETHERLDVGCLLALPEAAAYQETLAAYDRHIASFGPDDVFTLLAEAEPRVATLPADALLALLRLSRFDSEQLAVSLPRLAELAPTLTRHQFRALAHALEETWVRHYPLDDADLAYACACLLLELDDEAGAVAWLERSAEQQRPPGP